MAYSNLEKNRSKFKTSSKFKLDMGETQKDKTELFNKYTKMGVMMKSVGGLGDDFPSRVHRIIPEELQKYNKMYFTPDPVEAIQLEVELENSFRNKEIEERIELQRRQKEQEKVKEFQDITETGLNVPEDVNPFSPEGQAYLRSEASQYEGGYEELIKDGKKAREQKNRDMLFQKMDDIATRTINQQTNLLRTEKIFNQEEMKRRYGKLYEEIQRDVVKEIGAVSFLREEDIRNITNAISKRVFLENLPDKVNNLKRNRKVVYRNDLGTFQTRPLDDKGRTEEEIRDMIALDEAEEKRRREAGGVGVDAIDKAEAKRKKNKKKKDAKKKKKAIEKARREAEARGEEFKEDT